MYPWIDPPVYYFFTSSFLSIPQTFHLVLCFFILENILQISVLRCLGTNSLHFCFSGYIALNLERRFPWVIILLKVIFSQHIDDIIWILLEFIVDVEKSAIDLIFISLWVICFLWLLLRSTLCLSHSAVWSEYRLLFVYPAWEYWDFCICRLVSFINPENSHPLTL